MRPSSSQPVTTVHIIMNSGGDLPLPLPLYRIEQSESQPFQPCTFYSTTMFARMAPSDSSICHPLSSPTRFHIMGPSPYLLVSPIRLNCFLTVCCQLISFPHPASGTLLSFYPLRLLSHD